MNSRISPPTTLAAVFPFTLKSVRICWNLRTPKLKHPEHSLVAVRNHLIIRINQIGQKNLDKSSGIIFRKSKISLAAHGLYAKVSFCKILKNTAFL